MELPFDWSTLRIQITYFLLIISNHVETYNEIINHSTPRRLVSPWNHLIPQVSELTFHQIIHSNMWSPIRSRFTLKIKSRWWTWAVYFKQFGFVCELFHAGFMNMEIMKRQTCRASLSKANLISYEVMHVSQFSFGISWCIFKFLNFKFSYFKVSLASRKVWLGIKISLTSWIFDGKSSSCDFCFFIKISI